jgi:hypothetical protein
MTTFIISLAAGILCAVLFALKIIPALSGFLTTYIVPCSTAAVSVSASIDGGITYSETNLKRVPQRKDFFLKFEVSIRRHGLYIKNETFNFTVENTGTNKLTMDAIEYSGEKTSPPDTFKIVVSRCTGKNTVIYRCTPKDCDTSTLPQIRIQSTDPKLSSLDETFALVFVPESETTAKISVKGELEVKTEK